MGHGVVVEEEKGGIKRKGVGGKGREGGEPRWEKEGGGMTGSWWPEQW